MAYTNNDEGYIHISIPTDYIELYKRIAILLADYGEEMLKDCKAQCKDRNAGIIECYNMFNAAIAAYELGKYKLANTLVKYIGAKLNEIYKQHGVPIPIIPDPGPGPGPEPTPTGSDYWYIGQITKTVPEFKDLLVSELLNNSTAYSVKQKIVDFNINNSCWYIMVPSETHVSSAKYTVDGITTTFTQDEIENQGFLNPASHGKILIDDTIYNVYVNRNSALVDSNAAATVIIK